MQSLAYCGENVVKITQNRGYWTALPLPPDPILELLVQDSGTSNTLSPQLDPNLELPHGGLRVVDVCVETTAVSPE